LYKILFYSLENSSIFNYGVSNMYKISFKKNMCKIAHVKVTKSGNYFIKKQQLFISLKKQLFTKKIYIFIIKCTNSNTNLPF